MRGLTEPNALGHAAGEVLETLYGASSRQRFVGSVEPAGRQGAVEPRAADVHWREPSGRMVREERRA